MIIYIFFMSVLGKVRKNKVEHASREKMLHTKDLVRLFTI